MTGSGAPGAGVDDVLPGWDGWWGGGLERALTLAMREEVVSERGGGAGVIISGAHTVTAEGGTELLHACQSFCRQEGCETGEKNHRNRQTKRGIFIRKEELKGVRHKVHPSVEGKHGRTKIHKG